jgi:hypothetical protein
MLQRRARGWFCGFRLAVKTDLGSRIVRARSIVQGAVNEHEVAEDLPATCPKRIATPSSSP